MFHLLINRMLLQEVHKLKIRSSLHVLTFQIFSEALGIYNFDRYYRDVVDLKKPFYVKDTNDFVLYARPDTWCIGRDLSQLNIELCVNDGCRGIYCPNFVDYERE